MTIKDAKVERVQQWIDEDLLTDLEQHPSRIKRWFVDNIFRRVLAYLVGMTEGGKAVVIRCTADGKVKFVSGGSGFTRYASYDGTCTDDYADSTEEFPEACAMMDMLIEGEDILASIRDETNTWGDDIVMPIGAYPIEFVATGIKLKNRTQSENAHYDIQTYR